MPSNNPIDPAISSETTLTDFFELRYAAAHRLEASTLHYYRKNLRRFERWLGRSPILADLNDETVTRFFRSAPHSTAALTAVWRYAGTFEGLSTSNHRSLLKPKRAYRSREPWTAKQFAALLGSAQRTPGIDQATGIPKASYWLAFVRTAHETSLHYGDLIKLTIDDVKSLPLTRVTLEAIRAVKPESRPTIFGSGYSRSIFKELRYRDLLALMKRAFADDSASNDLTAASFTLSNSFTTLLQLIDD